MAAFWVTLVVTIRLAVCFPRSRLARILFSRIDPQPLRGETRSDYLIRLARFGLGFFMQAAFLFAGGWLMLLRDETLVESLYFIVLWAAVVPLLGGAALLGGFFALVRSVWLRRVSRTHAASNVAQP